MDDEPLTGRSSIHRLRVVHTIPVTAPPSADARDALAAALNDGLAAALDARFDQVEGDGGVVWIIRDLDVAVTVPLTLADAPSIAARLARAVELAVLAATRGGARDGCMRFDNDAAYTAAFVAAVLAGRDDTWVFERLAPARGLTPVAALLVAHRLTGSELLEVVAALVDQGTWEPFVLRLSAPDADALAAAIVRDAAREAPDAELRERVRGIIANAVTPGPRLSPSALRLVALGRALLMTGVEPGLVAAALGQAEWSPIDHTDRRPLDRPAPHQEPVPGLPAAPVDPSHVRAAGAATFIVATSIPALADDLDLPWLLDELAPSAAVRATILGRVLGVPDDDQGVRIAAGLPPQQTPEEQPAELDDDRRRDLDRATRDLVITDDDRAWLARDPEDAELTALAALLGRTFLRRLVGFQTSPLPYLVPRLFGRVGTISLDPSSITVELECPPLLVVLQLAGLADFAVALPWLDRVVLVHHEAAS